MKIIDLSHWNNVFDWDKIKYPIILKCTESTNYIDSTFKERQKILREKNLYYGAYHFFRDNDPVKQAEFFLKNVDYQKGDILILDFEIDIKYPVEKCTKFLNKIKEVTGEAWLYTNDARAVLYSWPKDWKFWIARYGINDGNKNKQPSFKHWSIWQYTSRGVVNGIDGNIDLNETISQQSNYDIYSQKDPRWKDIVIGKSGNKCYTIGSDGCFLTCLSMMCKKTPDEVFILLRKGGAITDGGLIISDKAAKILGLQLLPGNSNIPGKMTDINYMPDWSPCIKEVDYNSKTAVLDQHFVLRIIENGKRYIIDPLGGVKREVNYYKFKSYRLFK